MHVVWVDFWLWMEEVATRQTRRDVPFSHCRTIGECEYGFRRN